MRTQIQRTITKVLYMLGIRCNYINLAEYNRLNKLGVGVIW